MVSEYSILLCDFYHIKPCGHCPGLSLSDLWPVSDAGASSLGPGNTFTIWPWDTFRGSYLRRSNSLHAGMPHFLRIQTVMLSVVLCPLLSQIYTHSQRISRHMISTPPTCWTLDSPSFLCRLDAPPPYPRSPGLYACPLRGPEASHMSST